MLAEPSATSPATGRWCWIVLATLAAAMAAWFGWHVVQRLPYPYELEWMEGAMVDHAERVRAGLDLYVPPGPDHVQFLYTPLLFYLGALVATVTGPGYLPLRLVSLLATLGCAWLLVSFVRRETGHRLAGFVAAGLLLSGYGYLRSWYDLARNDMLMLAGMLGALWLLRFRGRRAAMLAAAAVTLAFLAKQSALLWLPALATGALLLDWRKGLVFVTSTALLLGGTLLGYDLATDGWFTFFVFEMPSHHAIEGSRKLGFFTEDMVPMWLLVPPAVASCVVELRAGRGRPALFLAAFGSGGVLVSYLSRLHTGGFDNALIPAFAAGCLLAPIAAARARRPWPHALLLVAQFACLVWDPRSLWLPRLPLQGGGAQFLPTAAHRAASEEMVAWLRAVPGDVFVPFHGHLATLAGKPSTAHAQAMFDLLQVMVNHGADPERLSPRARTALAALQQGFLLALEQQRFAVIVLDLPHGPAFEQLFAPGLGRYERSPASPIREPKALQPPVGMETHSPYVLQARR